MLKVLTYLMPALLKLLKPEILKSAIDAMLDKIESAVEGSENKVDDAMVLPLCKVIRESFNIPDND